jgi:hypothetical protein
VSDQPKTDRSFSIGELVAYMTAWAVTFAVVTVSLQDGVDFAVEVLACGMIAALVCFAIAFLVVGRQQVWHEFRVLLVVLALLMVFMFAIYH